MSPAIETYDDTILADLSGALTRQAAEGILSLGFSDQQRQRMHELAEKARSGELSDQERAEANSFERVSSLLGILQSRARIRYLQAIFGTSVAALYRHGVEKHLRKDEKASGAMSQ